MKKLLQTREDWSLLILRITVAIVIFPHGAQKLLGWFGGGGYSKTIGFFGEYLGVNLVFTTLVIIAEFFGTIALALGLLSRFVAGSIMAIMFGAIFLVHGKWGFFMNWYARERGEGIEFHLLVLGICLVLLIYGGGKWSLDRAINKRHFE